MFTVAGAPLIPTWEWRCPSCKRPLRGNDEKILAGEAHAHFESKHGPLEGQSTIFDELSTSCAPSAPAQTAL